MVFNHPLGIGSQIFVTSTLLFFPVPGLRRGGPFSSADFSRRVSLFFGIASSVAYIERRARG